MIIKQAALAPSPQPRPAPTARALPPKRVDQRGPFWVPIRGPIPTPIDRLKPMSVENLVSCALAGIERDRLEIRPGLSNMLKLMSRLAPTPNPATGSLR